MAKITIQTNTADSFKFKKDYYSEFEVKAKIFELKKIYKDNVDFYVKATQANTGDLLFSEKIEDITVDGTVYTNYEDLSEVLTPLLFKKGGGSGGGGTIIGVTNPLYIIDDNISIYPASSGNRGTISSSDYIKLSEFSDAEFYSLKTDLPILETSIQTWVNNKNYASQIFVSTNYYNKNEIDSKLSATYTAKGNVANFASLPTTDRKFGDVWNLLDTGDNYVWIENYNNTGSPGWDKLAGIVDLSLYHTITQYQGWVTSQNYITNSSLTTLLANKENLSNKKSSWSTTPTNDEYPTAKLVKDSMTPLIKITTAVSINSNTVDSNSLGMNGRTTEIANGSNNINFECLSGSAPIALTLMKTGTGTITFTAGSGVIIKDLDLTKVLNGGEGSQATLTSSDGTIYYLTVYNR